MQIKKLLYYLHAQVHGFFQSGKKIVPPANRKELMMSRFLAFLLVFFLFLFVLIFIAGRHFLPVRIWYRFIIVLIPYLTFVVLLYKGISLGWMFSGLIRYWLITSYLLFTAFVLIFIFVEIFIPGAVSGIFLLASFIPIFTGIIFGSYFRIKAIQSTSKKRDFSTIMTAFFYHIFSLVFLIFFFGGLAIFAQFSGISDWFFNHVLGW
jgi:hypothetical protein